MIVSERDALKCNVREEEEREQKEEEFHELVQRIEYFHIVVAVELSPESIPIGRI